MPSTRLQQAHLRHLHTHPVRRHLLQRQVALDLRRQRLQMRGEVVIRGRLHSMLNVADKGLLALLFVFRRTRAQFRANIIRSVCEESKESI